MARIGESRPCSTSSKRKRSFPRRRPKGWSTLRAGSTSFAGARP